MSDENICFDCGIAIPGVPGIHYCPACAARIEHEVRLEEEQARDEIEWQNLRGITPPDY